jgi:NADH-quinone oxidoreductase subunit F
MTLEMPIATRNAGKINPESIEDYLVAGGYEGLKKARSMGQSELIEMLERAGKLRGRGGAGFNTGMKWKGAFQAPGDEKYVICNADEGEPGTYKDRYIIENDPHTIIEGMLICAYAIGAKQCYIYCRGEYSNLNALLKRSICAARENGLCGEVDMHVATGAGSYVCGEETTLIESLEGKRGEPRLKPPFPVVAGFRAKPTVVNNVETFATVPVIVDKGPEWFSAIGSPKYPGTKVFALSGDVVKRVCLEAPTNITLRELIYDFGGGIAKGHALKAVQVGGTSCGFLTPDKLDTPMDFDSLREIGGALGSGAILVIDDTHNLVDILVAVSEFFVNESCGKCAPCREGTLRAAELVKRIADGNGGAADLEQITVLAETMTQACFCPLGQSATTAICSAMKLFPGDFQTRIKTQEVNQNG